MALFKCKMCGGSLELTEVATIAKCEYCGTKQTVPMDMNENLHSLFNRANSLRIRGEFDKAEQLYEKIVHAEPSQSEAYWGLILCKYGIEYVDDPKTYKKIPTCHRASYDSIIADSDYKSALEYADINQRVLYEEQAKEIDRIQKDILALAQKEEAYDVFICYKETDENGKRTQDSVIANDIYYQLTQEGFKVFYAAITLEDKLGSAYEPIIFAALNSAKVMLVIGTKPEYFDAVWVKNEWSRFLKIIKKDRSKLLVPCYRDMDAYDLPEEFAHMQAQDMSKIGFINDLIRGIKKILNKDQPQPTTIIREPTVSSQAPDVSNLLKRAKMFIEDRNWAEANNYCEKVLDMDPENAQAFWIKFQAIHQISKDADWRERYISPNDPFYLKILKYGDDTLVNHVQERYKTIASPFIMSGDILTGFINTGYDSEVIIPDTVRVIGKDAFKGQNQLRTVVISNSVTRIEEHAFYSCPNLSDLTFGNRVSYIGKGAFAECASLTGIVIPDSVTVIDEDAFWLCVNLEKVIITNRNTQLVKRPFDYCDKLKAITRGGTSEKPKTFLEEANKRNGCYVATCVYGSYDCPQVWTLRRFRDDTLGATWYGRAFIRTYYAISPTLVKWFGKTSWFKRMWHGTLDRMVAKLNSDGVADTPYQDKDWR